MENGTESENFMALPSVRLGLKREFEFAFKSHAEICGTLGRTRSAKRKVSAPEPSSDSEDPSHDAFDRSEESNETGSFLFPSEERKLDGSEEKMGFEYFPAIVETVAPKMRANNNRRSGKKFPSRLKDLINTGILEGLNVRYMKGPKAIEAGYKPLRGVISGSGISCHCDSCSGTYVVTPCEFELHAGSGNKRPPEYIHLDNGNTLRDVIIACQSSSLPDLEQTLRTVIGVFVIEASSICFNCKRSRPEAGSAKSALLCDSCVDLEDSQFERVESADHNSNYVSPKPIYTPKRSDSEPKFNASQRKSQGRITKKDTRLHKMVFKEDNLLDGTQVAYYVRGKKYMTGYKKGFGIFCDCCSFEISPSQFEAHAGWATRRKPYLHICTSNGMSLHDLSVVLARERKLYSFEKDDLCFVCQGGGDFVCCNGCPRVFHEWCLHVPNNPGDVWYCKLCRNMLKKNKYVGHYYNAVAAGRVEGVDPLQHIANRCIRLMNTEDFDFGGCALCKGHDFSKSGFDSLTVLFCDQCEKEFHVGCLKTHGLEDLKEVPEGMWFCCSDCENISHSLQELTVNGPEKLPEPLLKSIKNEQSEGDAELDVKWRIINWKVASDEESELLLSEALAIFRDRFTPITDPATTRDLIPEMLYGNSFMGQDFSRMYCAVLTVNGCAVLAGIFRIYGTEVAELPLVATRAEYQGQGYFKSWFSCFQRFLAFLNVRNLVLPSAAEAESIWTIKFGFTKIDINLLTKYTKQYQLMRFQGTAVLWKSVFMAEEQNGSSILAQ